MKYAIVDIQGKQFKVQPGQVIVVDKMDAEVGDVVNLDKVLLMVNDDAPMIGSPVLDQVKLTAKVLEQFRGDKIRVAKFRSKSRYRKVNGHRQEQTRIEISLAK